MNATVLTAAGILAARRRSGAQGARLPESCRPADIGTALAIQDVVTAVLGEVVSAWKCGMPNPHGVVLAPIYAPGVFRDSPCTVWDRGGQTKIEPELAFVLGRDLPAREQPYNAAEVEAAIATVHLALELIDSRYAAFEEISFAESLADGLVNQGLFIGPQVDKALALHAAAVSIEMQVAGALSHFDGRHPAGDAGAPLVWLVNHLRASGCALSAGQAVITGSFAGSIVVPLNTDISFTYGALGTLRVRFTAR